MSINICLPHWYIFINLHEIYYIEREEHSIVGMRTSEWDPLRRYERERERRLWDPWARLEYERERYYSDPWYRFEKDRERYYTDPFFRFEKEKDRLSWDPWYRELRRREWRYDEGNMFRDRVLSDLDRGSQT